MSAIYRSAYAPSELVLEDTTGCVPAYANPGALDDVALPPSARAAQSTRGYLRECKTHDVTWRGSAACFVCEAAA